MCGHPAPSVGMATSGALFAEPPGKPHRLRGATSRRHGRGLSKAREDGPIDYGTLVRQVPPRAGGCRPGCYTRCYTIFGDPGARGQNDGHKWRR